MTIYSETIDLTLAPVANGNRASAGYNPDILLAMVAPVAPGFYSSGGRLSHAEIIGNRDNLELEEHSARILGAAKALRGYGLRIRVNKYNDRPESITVYGPRSGGFTGRYSA